MAANRKSPRRYRTSGIGRELPEGRMVLSTRRRRSRLPKAVAQNRHSGPPTPSTIRRCADWPMVVLANGKADRSSAPAQTAINETIWRHTLQLPKLEMPPNEKTETRSPCDRLRSPGERWVNPSGGCPAHAVLLIDEVEVSRIVPGIHLCLIVRPPVAATSTTISMYWSL